MAENNSCSYSDIEKIHNELIRKLITGHVGQNENMDTYVNWKMRFRDHCDDNPAVLNGSVMGNFTYLEDNEKIAPGHYDVLKKIFTDDRRALRKIEEAVKKIKNIKYTAKSPNSRNKDEMASNVKILVEVKNDEGVFLRNLTSFLRKMVNNLKSEFPALPWINKGFTILHGGERDDTLATFCTKMMNVQENLEKMLSKESVNNPKTNSRKILGSCFALMQTIENETETGLTFLEIGWDQSTMILTEAAGGYNGCVSDIFRSLEKQVKFYFQNMLHPTRKEIEVLVAIEDITQSDGDNLIQKLSRDVGNKKENGMK